MKRALLLSGSLLSLTGQLFAGEWAESTIAVLKEAIQANQHKYDALPAFHLTTELLAYQNAGDVVPHDRGTSAVWKAGDRMHAEQMGLFSYQNKHMRLLVDPEEKAIYVGTPVEVDGMFGTDLGDALLKQLAGIGRLVDREGTHFRLKFPEGSEYEMMELLFDANGWLRRIDTYWQRPVPLQPDDPRSVVVRPKVVLQLGVPEAVDPASVKVDMNAVVVKGPDGFKPVGEWKDYQVFDTRVQ